MHLRKVTGNRKAECGSAGKLYLNYNAGRGRLTTKGKIFHFVPKALRIGSSGSVNAFFECRIVRSRKSYGRWLLHQLFKIVMWVEKKISTWCDIFVNPLQFKWFEMTSCRPINHMKNSIFFGKCNCHLLMLYGEIWGSFRHPVEPRIY